MNSSFQQAGQGAEAALSDNRRFDLSMPPEASRKLAAGWLWLGIASLVGAGMFAILLVMSRTPGVQDHVPFVDFFHTALVVHVNLSVLLWFIAFAGVLWSVNSSSDYIGLGWISLALATLGATMIVLSPFIGAGPPLMSNYVPVIQSTFFLTAVSIFAAGITLLVIRSLIAMPAAKLWKGGEGTVRLGFYAAAISTLFAIIAFVWSFFLIPMDMENTSYYDHLFWGGGHVLQFTYLLLMLTGWMWLADSCGAKILFTPRVASILLITGLVPVFYIPVIYLQSDFLSHYIMDFTMLMRIGASFAPVPVMLVVFYAVVSKPAVAESKPQRAALLCSLILFAVGAGISLKIAESNTIITAHYHGTGGAISLALMGLTFHLLPRLGYRTPELKLASMMPWVYGTGQLMHIIGLLWSGGYGVQRKVAGAAQGLHGFGQTAGMGLMGLGGLVAVVGGVMFLVVVFKAMRR
jgi:hypothetical protein